MNSEKSIVNHWLNSNGYFTINNLNASGNKNIGILGIKFTDSLVEAVHVEVYCSIIQFSKEDKLLKKLLNRFNDKEIQKAVNDLLGKQNYKFRKLLVASKIPNSNKESMKRDFSGRDIVLIEFEDVILDVMLSLDTPYYKDDVLRALQLVKFVLLSEPTKLAELLSDKGNILNVNTRGIFLNQLLKQELIKKELTKADDEQIIEIIKSTQLRKPARLAKALEDELLNKRGMNKLLSILSKTTPENEKEPDVKHLSEFF